MSTTLVQTLQAFNRKERYWLLRDALGTPGAQVPLSEDFRERLSSITEKTVERPVPKDAWWAMDYHIDWLFAALVHFSRGNGAAVDSTYPNPSPRTSKGGAGSRLIRGTQEDFDMIVAFDDVLILLEAKFEGAWSNSQVERKRERLRELDEAWPVVAGTGDRPCDHAKIVPVLTSPKQSKRLVTDGWPEFLHLDGDKTPFFMPLTFTDAPNQFLVPLRCDEGGTSDAGGGHWSVRSVQRPREE